jgi:hypothetical protein
LFIEPITYAHHPTHPHLFPEGKRSADPTGRGQAKGLTKGCAGPRLCIVPLTLAEANAQVERLSRHHQPARGHRWSIGVEASGLLVGAAIAGRPVARMLDDGQTIEVTRLVSDGTPNVCSCLLGAMRRVARAMGYARIITYTLASESGTSLRAAGWTATTLATRVRHWDTPARRRARQGHEDTPKVRWECRLRSETTRTPRGRPVFGEAL